MTTKTKLIALTIIVGAAWLYIFAVLLGLVPPIEVLP
jgi:hypothetical protein